MSQWRKWIAIILAACVLAAGVAVAEMDGESIEAEDVVEAVVEAPAEDVEFELEDATEDDEIVEAEPQEALDAEAPAITTQPADVTAEAGEIAKFTVAATGTGLTYQWEYQPAGKSSWSASALSTANRATLHVPANKGRSGMKFRCRITDANGASVVSDAATLTTTGGDTPTPVTLAITKQPEDQSGALGATVTFTVEATGNGLSYSWETQHASGGDWVAAGGYAAKFSVTVTSAGDGSKYRCVVTDENGAKVTSNAATMTVSDGPIVQDGVIYELLNGIMTVTGYQGSASAVTVRETVGGETVTVIAENAFAGKTSITTIDLPDTIVSIADSAFDGCTALKSVN